MMKTATIIHHILDVLLPQSCLVCKLPCSHPIALCISCQSLISFISESSSYYKNSKLRALATYQTPVKELIQQGKFNDNLVNFKALAQLFAQQIIIEGYDNKLVLIPVPLHPKRLLSRGYNQAHEIARPLSKLLQLEINNDCIFRTKEANIQHLLTKKQRKFNADQLFKVKHKVPKKVAIIDDVYTTGATMQSICTCLQKAGAESIELWILARTLKQT